MLLEVQRPGLQSNVLVAITYLCLYTQNI